MTNLVDPIQEDQNENRVTESEDQHNTIPGSQLRYHELEHQA